jgi:aromatic-amino-acid transaminase
VLPQPTGVDLNEDQWRQVIGVLKARKLLPFVDMAYQGFGAGLDDDAFAVRELARQNVPCLVANSFSKNFSLYGERCGGLSVVCQSADEASRVLGQLTGAVRANYSNPPTHGARVVARVLTTPALRKSWEEELAAMCQRIARMRQAIHDHARARERRKAVALHHAARHVHVHRSVGRSGRPPRTNTACTCCARAACAWPD